MTPPGPAGTAPGPTPPTAADPTATDRTVRLPTDSTVRLPAGGTDSTVRLPAGGTDATVRLPGGPTAPRDGPGTPPTPGPATPDPRPGRPMGLGAKVLLAGWLLILAAGHVAGFVAMWRFFVRSRHGQLLDTIALAGNYIGRDRVDGLVDTVLNAMSVLSLAIATAVIGFIALIRRRRALALMTIVLIVGANLTTQVLKYGLARPDLGVDEERAAAGNSLPSGHTTIAASVAVALVLVLPPRMRALGALVGAGYTALAGVATLSAGWHRPSDAVAALLVVGGWTAAASFILLLAQRRGDVVDRHDAHPVGTTVLVLAGIVLLAVAAAGVGFTEQVVLTPPEELGRRRLLAAYGGSAAGIAGAASLMMALILASVHRVVPRRP